MYFHILWKESCISIVWLSCSLEHINHSRTLTMDFSNLWKHCYRFIHFSFHTLYNYTWLTAISSHCLAALPAKMSMWNSHMQGSHSVISNEPRLHTKKKKTYSYNKNPENLCYEQKHMTVLMGIETIIDTNFNYSSLPNFLPKGKQ